ncbi:MAG: hypothetical protein GXP18_03675 [Gammaproteobacteria bacterium]|nr:hypothetical protein [Gammaproteobacteria bacterium]
MDSLRLFQGAAVAASLALASYITVVHVLDEEENNDTVVTSPDKVTSRDASRDILSYVPADTIYFFGGLEPASLNDMLKIIEPQWEFMQPADFRKTINRQLHNNKDMPPAAKMLTGLFIEYLTAFKDLKTAQRILGVGDELDAVFYSVGTTPVMRIKLADTNAFNTFIKSTETIALVTPVQETHGELSLRTYSFSAPGTRQPDSPDAKLVISVDNNYALITLLTPLESETTRDVILGTKKPVDSLADVTLLKDLKSRHDFHPAYLGYVSHVEIVKGLTTPEGNEFGRMLGTLLKTISAQKAPEQTPARAGEDSGQTAITQNEPMAENPLAPIQTTACRTELLAITQTWPRTVFGYTELNLKEKPNKIAMRMLVENTDAAFMQQLQQLRGFIPEHIYKTQSRPALGFGFGFNIDALTPVVSQIFTEFTQKDYQCQFLAEMKQGLIGSNPVLALGMMTGMAAGVQGISAAILDVDAVMNLDQKDTAPDIRSLDAIITISAKEPQRLLLMAANFQQGMPPIQLPADGTPIDFPIPLPTSDLGNVKLALKGNHIVAYIGDKAEQLAQTMANDPLTATGMFALNINFGKYMRFINDFVQAADTAEGKISEQDKTMLEGMAKVDMQFVESFDMTPQGIVLDATMTMH